MFVLRLKLSVSQSLSLVFPREAPNQTSLQVNPDRWYYAADKAGIVILQDMVQHYGDRAVQKGGLPAEARYYWHDLKAMIDGVGNHPSIIQWETFNEGDMVSTTGLSINFHTLLKIIAILVRKCLPLTNLGQPLRRGQGRRVDQGVRPDPPGRHPPEPLHNYISVGQIDQLVFKNQVLNLVLNLVL
jgi:hypothetical protein